MSTPGNAGTTLVADLGERGLIERIRRRLPPADGRLALGIGDDAAVVVPERGELEVMTTDALVEGIHFERRYSSLADIGHKALAVNLSDIAAMGGSANHALLSLMLPGDTTVEDVDALLDGFLGLAAEARVSLAGGNVTRSPGPLIVDVTVTGHVHRRKLLRRSSGRPGDGLFVTGTVGAAAAGLDYLKASSPQLPASSRIDECVARYRRPAPRVRLGRILGRTGAAGACMDLSDGLADAVIQIAEASGTGAIVDAASLPIHPAAKAWFESRGMDPVVTSAAGGDDYELLFSVPKRAGGRLRAAVSQGRGVAVTRVGELTSAGGGILLRRDGRDEPLPKGYVHF